MIGGGEGFGDLSQPGPTNFLTCHGKEKYMVKKRDTPPLSLRYDRNMSI